jgi:O-succinylbenzoic acid--CoA ligase
VRVEPILAGNDPRTISAVIRALREERPIALIHPRWSKSEQESAVGVVRALGDLEDTAAIFWTSGTTGNPRPVMLSKRALTASARAWLQAIAWRDDDRWLLALPIAHVGGFSIITRSLEAQAGFALPEATPSFDPSAIIRAIEAKRVTLVSLVPTMLRRLLDSAPEWTPPRHLRAVIVGGDSLSPKLRDKAGARGLCVRTTYGLTEAASTVTLDDVPLKGVGLRIDDGEIEIAGPMLMNGAGPWLKTGDLGRIDALDRLSVLGRKRELIISGGENVYPAYVEAILESSPDIESACVFGVPDEEWGEVVCAAIVPASPIANERAIDAFVRERLGPFERPRRIRSFDRLPLLASGKRDRRSVKERWLGTGGEGGS